MADVFDFKKRSQVMSSIRGKGNKSTELTLATAFRRAGISGWRRHVALKTALGPRIAKRMGKTELVVRPDFVFRRERVAIFVDGCFWHQCPLHSKVPANNREFWAQKLARNVERDRIVNKELQKADWKVFRVWEHELAATERIKVSGLRDARLSVGPKPGDRFATIRSIDLCLRLRRAAM